MSPSPSVVWHTLTHPTPPNRQVLTGGKNLLKHNVHYIMAECNVDILGEKAANKFIQFLYQQGFEVSQISFKGPFWDVSQLPTASCDGVNLFARRRP